MTDTLADGIIGIITSIFSNFQVVFALLLIVVISACFLGRQVELSKKLVLSALGITGVTLICIIVLNLIAIKLGEELILLLEYALVGVLYIYAFVFFLLAFKEKRVKRAIEAWIWFFLFVQYISTFSNLTVLYLAG